MRDNKDMVIKVGELATSKRDDKLFNLMKELFYLPVIIKIREQYNLTEKDAIKLYKEFLKFYKSKPFNKNIYNLFKNFKKQSNTASQTNPPSNNNTARTSQKTTGTQGTKQNTTGPQGTNQNPTGTQGNNEENVPIRRV